jgi:hypothetical protein
MMAFALGQVRHPIHERDGLGKRPELETLAQRSWFSAATL